MATGDYQIDFTGLGDVNPYVNGDFTFLGGDQKIESGVLKPSSSSGIRRAFYNVEAPSDPVIRSKVNINGSSAVSGDHRGPALYKTNGEGYHVYISGGLFILYKVTSGGTPTSITSLGSQTFADGALVELEMTTATGAMEVFLDSVSIITQTDTTYPQGDANGDFRGGWFNNWGNVNAGGIEQFALDGLAASGLTIDTPPADVRATESRSIVVSTPATVPTVGNTTVKLVDAAGPAATIDSVTGADPYTINFTFPRTTAKLFDATGYALYVVVDAENATSSVVPYLPATGMDFIDLSSPVNTAGTLGETYAGTAAATSDQWVHDTLLTGDATVGMDVDAQGYWILDGTPTVNSTAGFYRIDSLGTVDVEDTITFIADSVAPILTLPTGTKTGHDTASGTVTTDEGNGTLYYYASINSSELAATIKASGSNQAVSVTGVQNVSVTSLTPETTYYLHYVHTDAATNDSNVVSSTSFLTDVAPDVTAPVLSSPTGAETGAATASGTVVTDEGNGTLYYYASVNASETAATIKASGSNKSVSLTGSQAVSVTGLTPETLYYLHYVQDDVAANESNVVSSTGFTTLSASTIPPASRTSIFHVANYLRSLGTYNNSQCNSLVMEWLISEGVSRTQINQMLYGYLGGLGYTGTFNDRLKAWSEDV